MRILRASVLCLAFLPGCGALGDWLYGPEPTESQGDPSIPSSPPAPTNADKIVAATSVVSPQAGVVAALAFGIVALFRKRR